jgi:hypothetical protein
LEDLNLCQTYKKYINKILALGSNFPKINLILISNFNLSKSELATGCDFSSFVSICFPNIKKDIETIKEIILSKVNREMYDSNIDEVLNKCILNFNHSITNLNEYIFCIIENLEDYCNRIKNDCYLQNHYNELIKGLASMNISGTGEKNEKFFNYNNANSQNFSKIRLNEKIHYQISVTPIHLKSLDINETNGANSKINFLQSAKNLTESLSMTQKILLLSAFLASETSPKNDCVIFKNVKNTKLRIRKVIFFIVFNFLNLE